MRWPGLASRLERLGRSLRSAFTHNLGLKIISVAVAIGLFSMVRGAEDSNRSVFVEVVALLPPPSSTKMLVSDVPDRVRLTVRGSRSLVSSIRSEDLPPVQVDLRETSASYYYFDTDQFEIPAGVEIVQLAPASIPLRWAERVERDVSVFARLEGSPGPGLAAQAVEVLPSEVRVRGPEMEVDSLQHVETEPIDVRGMEVGRHERRVSLEPSPPHTRFDDTAVEVVVEVVAQEAERHFEGLKLSTVGGAASRVRPDRVDVTLWGPLGEVERVKNRHLVPTIDVGDLDSEQGTQELHVEVRNVPRGVQVRPYPDKVLVTP
ncbi:MAG: YbbR-like domain-containing protein [Myxococcota bacterium]